MGMVHLATATVIRFPAGVLEGCAAILADTYHHLLHCYRAAWHSCGRGGEAARVMTKDGTLAGGSCLKEYVAKSGRGNAEVHVDSEDGPVSIVALTLDGWNECAVKGINTDDPRVLAFSPADRAHHMIVPLHNAIPWYLVVRNESKNTWIRMFIRTPSP